MNEKNQEAVRDARQLGIPKMLILGMQHMFAMFYDSGTYSCSRIFSEFMWRTNNKRSYSICYTVLCRYWNINFPCLLKI